MSDDPATLYAWFEQRLASHHQSIRDMFHDILKEIRTMSGQFETDLAAQTTAIQGLAAEVASGLAANAAAITALQQQIANGGSVSATDLATLEGNTAAIIAATGSLTAALNPASATPAA